MTRLTLHELTRRQRIARRRQASRDRRGVLLMVVLAMLALFLLIGTAFLVTSNHYADSGKIQAKANRVSNQPSDELERALMQVLRDTNNPHSAIRWHSLLRDMYGTDGFIGRVYANDSLADFVAQYAGAYLTPAQPLGTTEGQLIDIYVLDQPATQPVLEAANVIKIERGANGLPVDHQLPGANGYYAGCLLTMLEGPAAGRTTRIVDYTFVGQQLGLPLYRLRVMGFTQSNGNPLNVGGQATSFASNDRPNRPLELRELVGVNPQDINDYQGYAFIVNGRPHNGTGVGLNNTAASGQPKLGAMELTNFGADLFASEVALTPNAQFVDTSQVGTFDTLGNFLPLNQTGVSMYPNFEGLGGSDESYDAVDYQNMFLASVPLTPRSRGGYYVNQGGTTTAVPADQQQVQGQFVALDLENVPIPSFHRPALVNYWFHRLANNSYLTTSSSPAAVAIAAISPYGPDGVRNTSDDTGYQLPLAQRDQLVAIKRKFMMRPLREDHPGFDGSNPLSHYSGVTPPRTVTVTNGQILFPYWEAIGPWDVDNDGDGVPDSVWVDTGEPIQETEDGRLYKRLYAYLIVDMDNRLDLNAHGSSEHMVQWNPNAQPNQDLNNLDATSAHPNVNLRNVNLFGGVTSNIMPQGMGYGTGDISLRPVLSPNLPTALPGAVGNAAFDDYARLLAGNLPVDGFNRPRSEEWGKFGSQQILASFTPGTPFNSSTPATIAATRDTHTWFDFTGYPETDTLRNARLGQPFRMSAFSMGTAPDLKCRYSGVGISYNGQPVNESVWDATVRGLDMAYNAFPVVDGASAPAPALVDDSPYEINLSYEARKDIPQFVQLGTTDDAPFATAELERIVRGYDADVGTLPSRLWNLVDAFDPVKYAEVLDDNYANGYTPQELALAQTVTAINRRSVTTDSSSAPVPSEQVPSYISELGADGKPGNAGVDDSGSGTVDDLADVGFHRPLDGSTQFLTQWSDDFASLTGKSVGQARLVDVAWYRIQKSRIERGLPPYNFNNPQSIVALNNICEQILAPEILRGEKMDLNRPFGNGLDDNGNGVVDEPIEAGEPFVDINRNGRWDGGEPFINLDNSFDNNGPTYTPPTNEFPSDEFNGVNRLAVAGDLVMGLDVSGRSVAQNAPLRDDQHLARQLYARHLYVAMLLLTDENYVAPYDHENPQVRNYINQLKQRFVDDEGKTEAEAQFFAQRRMSFREVAQWAINCVDFRDADATCTPFEYDENPWDGWNVTGLDENDDYQELPIDGDPATNENEGEFNDWDLVGTDNNTYPNGKPVYTTLQDKLNLNANPMNLIAEQTRQIVWGAERPELLITETLAWHDKRTEDDTNSEEEPTQASDPWRHTTTSEGDDDLDQSLRPQGSAFVELYNPWSSDGSRPVEIYSTLNVDNANPQNYQVVPSEGVELGRLSTIADSQGRRSPVWRMVVVEEDPLYSWNPERTTASAPSRQLSNQSHERMWEPRSSTPADRRAAREALATFRDEGTEYNITDPDAARLPFTDIDWIDSFTVPFRDANDGTTLRRVPIDEVRPIQFRGNSRQVPHKDPENGAIVRSLKRRVFQKLYPYIEKEFYFTSNGLQQRKYTDIQRVGNELNTQFTRLRAGGIKIPFGFVRLGEDAKYAVTYRFLALDPNRDGDVEIAPVLPGRYGLIGPAGPQYAFAPVSPYTNSVTTDPNGRFIIVAGRQDTSAGGGAASQNAQDYTVYTPPMADGVGLANARRFELMPSLNPNVQQLLALGNGMSAASMPVMPRDGKRRNELAFVNGSLQYITKLDYDPMDLATADPDSQIVLPTVVFPVDDFGVSVPVWGYTVREAEIKELELGTGANPNDTTTFVQQQAGGEGRYVSGATGQKFSFDTPFDKDSELERNTTLPTYRVMHLQRLADPSLPWNPRPDYGDAWRTASGATANETFAEYDDSLPVNPYVTVDSSSVDLTIFNGVNQETTSGNFASVERGRAYEDPIAKAPAEVRNLFKQAQPRKSSELGPSTATHAADKMNNAAGTPVLDHVDALGVKLNKFPIYIEHSLGMANESFGDIYFQAAMVPAGIAAPTGPAIGMPRPGDVDYLGTPEDTADDTTDNSTYNSLQWNNRPFISAAELLQVPSTSSALLLQRFSTPNPSAQIAFNAYAELGLYDSMGNPTTDPTLADADVTNAFRFETKQAYFGHLLNFFQSYDQASISVPTPDNMQALSVGAPNYYRMFDFVNVPSRFSHTDTMLSPSLFSGSPSSLHNSTGIASADDPRWGLAAPFNRVDNLSEPGRVNLNTMVGRRVPRVNAATPPRTWSLVYDGMMHRLQDGRDVTLPHLGPAWRDIVISRRGYGAATDISLGPPEAPDVVAASLNNNFPSMVTNPFRAPNEGELVPLQSMVRNGIDATLMRAHHYLSKPAAASVHAWGQANVDDDLNGWIDDTREAGYGDDIVDSITNPALRQLPHDPLFSAGAVGVGNSFCVDALRNPAQQLQPLTRIENLTTTRSGVFAVWVTVGYFEVSKAPNFDDDENGVQQKFMNQAGQDIDRARALYNSVYPDGYQLGKELGVDTGENERHRGFYLIDRTRPVAFKPGEDVNASEAILLRRRIE